MMEIGRELNGRYIVKELLGEGGEGRTYLAHDKQQNRHMAVKELCQKPSDEQLAAWEKLIQLGKLPGIVQLFEVFEEEQTFYMVMEYTEGTNGVQVLANSVQGIASAQAASILYPVVRGISILHENGLLHRDVSTDNIIITADGYGVLCDLSLICENRENGVVEGVSRVKNGFSPIEFYIDGGRQGQWSDVYEVCATLYHLLTGQVLAASTERGGEDPFAGFAVQLPEESLCVIRAGLEVKGEQRLDNLLPVCQILERASALEDQQANAGGAFVPVNPGQPYIAQNGMRTLPLNAQSVISFNPDNAMNAKKKKEHGTGRKMIMAFATVCVLLVFFAAGILFYNAKTGDGDSDSDSAKQEDSSRDDSKDGSEKPDGADISLDELMELYQDYMKYDLQIDSSDISAYKLVCINDDGLPEFFLGPASLFGGAIMMYYNTVTEKCESIQYEITISSSTSTDSIKYNKEEGRFCVYDYTPATTNFASSEKNTYYQFGEEGNIEHIGYSEVIDGRLYDIANRKMVSLREYDEYNSDFGEFQDSFGYEDTYVTFEKAYEKFLEE